MKKKQNLELKIFFSLFIMIINKVNFFMNNINTKKKFNLYVINNFDSIKQKNFLS
jgi:hypothetical protein